MTDHSTKAPRKNIGIAIVLFLVTIGLVTTLYMGLNQDPKAIPSNFIGKPAMDFRVAWIQGEDILGGETTEHFNLNDFRGKNVILNFWASWCVSCRTEARDLEAIHRKYKDKDIAVVGIAIQDTIGDARRFASTFGKNYILGLDEDGKASIDYGVTGVPETFIIDKQGVVVHKEVGPVTTAMLEEFIAKM